MYSILLERGELPLEKYITTRFSGGKLDFSLIDDTHGFSLIDNENQNEFIDSKRIIRIRKASVIFQIIYGRKALKKSKSLNGTDVLVMWIMVFFMC